MSQTHPRRLSLILPIGSRRAAAAAAGVVLVLLRTGRVELDLLRRLERKLHDELGSPAPDPSPREKPKDVPKPDDKPAPPKDEGPPVSDTP